MNSKSMRYLLLIFLLFQPFTGINITNTNSSPTTHTIIVRNNSFSPAELKVNVGDRVFFNWSDTAKGHNVAQSETRDSLERLEDGFYSGKPVNGPHSWELPAQYLDENATLFYICVPHASEGMNGQITVGAGSSNTNQTTLVFFPIILLFVTISVIRHKF